MVRDCSTMAWHVSRIGGTGRALQPNVPPSPRRGEHDRCSISVASHVHGHHVVDPIEREMLANGSLRRLYRERVAGTSAVTIEGSDPALGVAVRDRRCLARLEPSEVQAVREGHEVAGESITTDVRALPAAVGEGVGERGRDRPSALRATRVTPSMRADDEERLAARLVTERAAVERIESDGVPDPVQGLRAEPGVARIDGEAAHRAGVVGCPAARSPDQQDARAALRFEGSEVAPDAGGEAGVEEPVPSPRSRMLDQQPMPDRRRRAGERLRRRQAPQRAAIVDRRHEATQRPSRIVSRPSRTSRRTRTARLPRSGTCSARSRTASSSSSSRRAT